MTTSRVDLAVLNSAAWYQAMFAAHGLASEVDGRVWRSHQQAPAFHSNLVVLASNLTPSELAACVLDVEQRLRRSAWSVKDSHACLDLRPRGFTLLFDAEWLWRDPLPGAIRTTVPALVWSRVASATELAAWEAGWWGDARNETQSARARQFPDPLLASADHAFFAGRVDGKVVAGGIANRSPGAVGLSNLFSPPAHSDEAWNALVSCTSTAFPALPIVGYERGDDLVRALQAGFVSIGALRVWQRTA